MTRKEILSLTRQNDEVGRLGMTMGIKTAGASPRPTECRVEKRSGGGYNKNGTQSMRSAYCFQIGLLPILVRFLFFVCSLSGVWNRVEKIPDGLFILLLLDSKLAGFAREH